MTSMKAVEDFLAQKRVALVGASRNSSDFSRVVMNELLARGYDVVPIHPSAEQIGDRKAFRSVSDADPPVSAALIMVPAAASAEVVRSCAQAGVRHVWLHRGGGNGSVSAEALEEAKKADLSVVDGHCPLMFLPNAHFLHRVHRFGKRILGSLPTAQAPG